MKRKIKASVNDRFTADLYVQYLKFDDIATNEIGIRSMTVKRPALSEALAVMLEHIDLGDHDIDYDVLMSGEYTKDEIIELITYANSGLADYILYLENRATGEVFIDENYPEENYPEENY